MAAGAREPSPPAPCCSGMTQIWLFVAGGVVMTAGIVVPLVAGPNESGPPAKIGLAITAVGLAIGLAGAFVG